MDVGRSRTAFRLRSRAMQPSRSTAGSAPGANPARLGVFRPDCGGSWTFVPDASSVTRRTPSRHSGPIAPGRMTGRCGTGPCSTRPPPAGRFSLVVHGAEGFHRASSRGPSTPPCSRGPSATTPRSGRCASRNDRPVPLPTACPSRSRSPPAVCDSTRRRPRGELQRQTAVDALERPPGMLEDQEGVPRGRPGTDRRDLRDPWFGEERNVEFGRFRGRIDPGCPAAGVGRCPARECCSRARVYPEG